MMEWPPTTEGLLVLAAVLIDVVIRERKAVGGSTRSKMCTTAFWMKPSRTGIIKIIEFPAPLLPLQWMKGQS